MKKKQKEQQGKNFVIVAGVILLLLIVGIIIIVIIIIKKKSPPSSSPSPSPTTPPPNSPTVPAPAPITSEICKKVGLKLNEQGNGCEMKLDIDINNAVCNHSDWFVDLKIMDGKEQLRCSNKYNNLYKGVSACKNSLSYYLPNPNYTRFDYKTCFIPCPEGFVADVSQDKKEPLNYPSCIKPPTNDIPESPKIVKCATFGLTVNKDKTGCEMIQNIDPDNSSCEQTTYKDKQLRNIHGKNFITCNNTSKNQFVGVIGCTNNTYRYHIPVISQGPGYNQSVAVCYNPCPVVLEPKFKPDTYDPNTFNYCVVKDGKNIIYE